MSSIIRDNRRAGEAFCNGIVRRMVNLPRNLIGGFSRVTGSGRRNQNQNLPSIFQLPHDDDYHSQQPLVPEEWTFLTNFEEQFGSTHPFFYVCHFIEALKIAEKENKFLFLYLHSPEHPFTPSFCRETLCSDLVVQYLDANFVSWGGIPNTVEGFQLTTILRPASYPFCAVIAPAPGDTIAVLQQIEGPISPAELVEILQRTVEEQGLAFGSERAKQAQKIKADRQLREEQDAAYLAAALELDKEKERLKNLSLKERVHKTVTKIPNKTNSNEKLSSNSTNKKYGKMKESSIIRESSQVKEVANRGNKDPQITQILIRFPNGERREHRFSCTDKVQAIYKFIDSLDMPGIGRYRLVSSFPRKVYEFDQMGHTLQEAGLHPRSSVFVEPLL